MEDIFFGKQGVQGYKIWHSESNHPSTTPTTLTNPTNSTNLTILSILRAWPYLTTPTTLTTALPPRALVYFFQAAVKFFPVWTLKGLLCVKFFQRTKKTIWDCTKFVDWKYPKYAIPNAEYTLPNIEFDKYFAASTFLSRFLCTFWRTISRLKEAFAYKKFKLSHMKKC